MALVQCPECQHQISELAPTCPYCGYRLMPDPPSTLSVPIRQWSPGIAAVLSLVIPGAGQMYKGQVLNGLVWLGVVIIGYFLFIVPGLVMHFFCIIGASMGDPMK